MILLLACAAVGTTEIHRETAGGVTAVWSGTAAGEVHSLCFILEGDTCTPYVPKGKLYPSDYRFGIFSPDGAWILLKASKYGPYDVVKVPELAAYLKGGDPYMRASAELGERFDNQKVMCVHHDERWLDADTFQYECGANPAKVVDQDVGVKGAGAPAAPATAPPAAPSAPAAAPATDG